jgi:uncharacterized membrane protein HdeD (DUF308 family)
MTAYRWAYLLEALILMSLGICAIALPQFFTFKLEKILGMIFISSGNIQILPIIIDRIQVRSLLYFFIALLYLVCGIVFWIHPIISMLSLGLILMGFLIADGIAKLLLGYQAYPSIMWAGFVVCGFLSLIMGLIIWIEWPLTSSWARGVFAGTNLLFYGSSLLAQHLSEHHIKRDKVKPRH